MSKNNSPKNKKQNPRYKNNNPQKDKLEEVDSEIGSATVKMANATIWIAVCSVLTFIGTGIWSCLQYQVFKESNRISNKTSIGTLNKMDSAMQIENRAFVTVGKGDDIGAEYFSPRSVNFGSILMTICNTGKTAASDIYMSCTCDTSPINIKNPIFNRVNINMGVLATNQSQKIWDYPHKINNKKGYIITYRRYMKKQVTIYFYGKITYLDIFQISHYTLFNYKISPEAPDYTDIQIREDSTILSEGKGLHGDMWTEMESYNEIK